MADGADVWTLLTSDADSRGYETYLDPIENNRWRRLLRSEDRDLFVLSHGFLRQVLAGYLDVSPADVAFTVGEYGKPAVEGLEFNMSHTHGLIGVVVTEDTACGIDVESLNSVDDIELVASTSMTAYEQTDIAIHDDPAHRFYRHWTLKEAYLKARGAGLRLPLDRFGFVLEPEPCLRVEPPIEDDPSGWTFHESQPSGDHHLAVAIAQPNQPVRHMP